MKHSFLLMVVLVCGLAAGCDDKAVHGPEGLEHKNSHVRRNTALWMGESGRGDTVETLSRSLSTDGDISVRAAAAYALGRNGDPAAIAPLREALTDKAALVRWQSVEALARLGAMDAVGDIEALLAKDADGWVRNAAAKALGQFRSEASIGTLIAALDDKDSRVKHSSLWSLGVITGRKDGDNVDAWKAWWDRVHE